MLKTKYKPDLIYRGKKPVAVVLKIKDYEDLLDELEDKEDLEYIDNLKKQELDFFVFDDYLKERGISV